MTIVRIQGPYDADMLVSKRTKLFSFLIGIIFVQFVHCVKGVDVAEDATDDDMTFATIMCRHGERTLYASYPNDPWQSEEYWPGGYQQLTDLGKRQQYELGEYLRDRYAKLIKNDEYSANKVYIRSSDTDRTLTSAEATMAGLFPPSGAQIWKENFNWQPIPIHSVPKNQDNLMAVEKPCDRYDYVMIEWQKTTEYTDLFVKYEQFIEYLEENSEKKLTSLASIAMLYGTFETEVANGYRLPLWAQQVWKPGGDLEYLALRAYAMWTATPEMKKFRSGFLLKEILDRFTNKTQSILLPDRSLWMYFGHDSTVSNMLDSLGLYSPPFVPPTSSCIFFELFQNEDNPYVQIFYTNSTKPNVSLPAVELPHCGIRCPLNKLYEIYDEILPKQSFDKECKLRDGESIPPGGNPEAFSL